jgi:fermentation-respiration switch protein FrsA (DUF1100 family)
LILTASYSAVAAVVEAAPEAVATLPLGADTAIGMSEKVEVVRRFHERGARLFLAIVLAVLAAAVLVVSSVPAATTPGRDHGAPYAVGLRSYTFVDATRPTPPHGTYGGAPSRTLPTVLIYPAEGDPSAPAVQNAPPMEHRRDFPLLVFAHGAGGNSMSRFAELTEPLVRAGFVVAAPTFPLSSAGAPGGPGGAAIDYVNQPGDVSFVISQVHALAREDRALGKTIDKHRTGVIGNSIGAVTVLGVATNSCCLDRRIDAAVSLWGAPFPFPGGSYFSEPTAPLMLAHGEADQTLPYTGSVSAYDQAPSPKVFLTLVGAPHNPFFAPWYDPLIRSVLDFLDGFLDHDPQAIRSLPSDANVPGVVTLDEDVTSCHWCG